MRARRLVLGTPAAQRRNLHRLQPHPLPVTATPLGDLPPPPTPPHPHIPCLQPSCLQPCCLLAGGTIPWVPRSVSPKIPLLDRAAIGLFDKFARAAIRTGRLRLILPSGEELVYGDASKTEAPVPKGGCRLLRDRQGCRNICAGMAGSVD